jgi:hypothetical protein
MLLPGIAHHLPYIPFTTLLFSFLILLCLHPSWAWFSFGIIRYNLSLATQFHISSQTLIPKLLFDVGRVVDQGPCGCHWQEVHNLFNLQSMPCEHFRLGWVFFSFLLNCQAGMLRVHLTDPKLYVLLHVLSCFIINCYLLHFFMLVLFYFSTSSHQPLPWVSFSSCCICLIKKNGTLTKYTTPLC